MAAMKHAGVTSVAIILLLAVTWGDARLLLQREDGSTEERCSSTHPYVGFTGEFNTRFHEVSMHSSFQHHLEAAMNTSRRTTKQHRSILAWRNLVRLVCA